MNLLTPELRAALRRNGDAPDHPGRDPAPLVKFFNPLGPATWLATELHADDDTLFGLADLGFGCPELGTFGLAELAAIRLPFGLGIERDLLFHSDVPLSVWARAARLSGSILLAERLAHTRGACRPDPLPDPETSG
jgi:hypothetical protein